MSNLLVCSVCEVHEQGGKAKSTKKQVSPPHQEGHSTFLPLEESDRKCQLGALQPTDELERLRMPRAAGAARTFRIGARSKVNSDSLPEPISFAPSSEPSTGATAGRRHPGDLAVGGIAPECEPLCQSYPRQCHRAPNKVLSHYLCGELCIFSMRQWPSVLRGSTRLR